MMRTEISAPVFPLASDAFEGRIQVGGTFETAIAQTLTRSLGEAATEGRSPFSAMLSVVRAALQTVSDLDENPDDATQLIAAGVVRGAAEADMIGADFFSDVGEAILYATNDRGGDLGTATRRLLDGVASGAESVGIDPREAVSAAACGAMETAARLSLDATARIQPVFQSSLRDFRPHRLIAGLALVAWLAGAELATAQESTTAPPPADTPTESVSEPTGSLGFHNLSAPIGIRWWLGKKVGLDLGVGYTSSEVGDERFSDFTLDAGIPIALKRWDRVNFLVRPGILYNSEQVDVEGGPGVTKENDTALLISAELEAEVFLADRFSVSASHGIGILSEDPALGDTTSDYGTIGSNFTNIGFHVYLFGGR